MKNSLTKGFILLVVAVGAVAICFLGYRINASRINNQKIDYAESTIKNGTELLAQAKTAADQLFTDESHQYLAEDVTTESVDTLITKVQSLQTSAEAFGISEKKLPSSIKELAQDKEAVLSLLKEAQYKLTLQDKINKVFTHEISNWQAAVDDVTIREDLTTDSLSNLQSEVSEELDSDWKKHALEYLSKAGEQLGQVTEIKEALAAYVSDGALTDEASYDNYDTLAAKISEVKNENLRNQLTDEANQLLALLEEEAPRQSSSGTSSSSSGSGYYDNW